MLAVLRFSIFARQALMLDNPDEMLGVEHTSLKKPCRTSWPVTVWSMPPNRPLLEPGASWADGRHVIRGHTDGHTYELRGCHHGGREFMCSERQRHAL